MGSGEETEAEEEEEDEKEGDRDRDTPRGAYVEVFRVGGGVPPPEKNSDLPDFTPESAHLLLWGVYGDYLNHNNGSHLYGGVVDDVIYQRCWRRLYTQSAS